MHARTRGVDASVTNLDCAEQHASLAGAALPRPTTAACGSRRLPVAFGCIVVTVTLCLLLQAFGVLQGDLVLPDADPDYPDNHNTILFANTEESSPALRSPTGPAESDRQICYAAPAEKVVGARWAELVSNHAEGLRRASRLRVLFAGLVRDAGKALPQTLEVLTSLGRNFRDYKVLVFENDSADKTVSVLQALAAKDPHLLFRNHTLGLGNTKDCPLCKFGHARVQRMAKVRNMLRGWILRVLARGSWDLVALVDADLGEFGPHAIEADMVIAALGRPESRENRWDVLCANSLRHFRKILKEPIGHHDAYAFRLEGHDEFNQSWGDYEVARRPWYEDWPLLPVHSCFGGFAMYNASAFARCRYDEQLKDCEHVGFHACLRSAGSEGRIFMDPQMASYYSKDVTRKCSNVVLGFKS